MREICLGVVPVMQPQPRKNPGGDCFACSMTAALRWVYQKPDLSFEDCWQCWVHEKTGTVSNVWPMMRTALYAASSKFQDLGLDRLEIANDFAAPEFNPESWSHGWGIGLNSGAYLRRLEGYLSCGWVALTDIDYAGRGPMVDGKWTGGGDHFIVLDGVRISWVPCDIGSVQKCEIHVVCSVRGAYWIELNEFHRKHGAGAWWLVRKDAR